MSDDRRPLAPRGHAHFNREASIDRLREHSRPLAPRGHADFGREAELEQRATPWDLLVVGGGATGVGIALDAASRGLEVVLLEQSDFGKGTSSRSTKLVHGGVRYLKQGNLTLVRDALRERTLLRNNAPHLVHELPFLIPCRSRWERFFYGTGMKLYDVLAQRKSFGRSYGVSKSQALRLIPRLRTERLAGGVVYTDGQFDDARLLISMARTASELGACMLNHMAVTGLTHDAAGKLSGATAIDSESGETYGIAARCVVNAAGPFCDAVRRLDDPDCEPMVAASQGVHIVLPLSFLAGETALMVPKTSDGRVLFVIPWHGHALVGTTDTPIERATLEPRHTKDEVRFLLETAAQYLTKVPTVDDVLSVFTGVRPLVKGDPSARTASLSRDHIIRVSPAGLITITGGKWTTVRKMAEDCVDRVLVELGKGPRPCRTETLKLHGYVEAPAGQGPQAVYGSDAPGLGAIEADRPGLAEPLHDALTLRGSEVVWAVRHEMARTVEDVLARRSRALILNARAALAVAARVAELMAAELGRDEAWQRSQVEQFSELAKGYFDV